MEKRFPKKRIFITGAGSGFGKALALDFAGRGWKVAAADINAESLEATGREIKALGGEPLLIPCDVTRIEDVEEAGRRVMEMWGGVDIAVNNAGVAAGGRMEKITASQWDRILDINLKGVIHGCRVFIPILEKQGKGHLVNMASSAGLACLPEMSSYNVTKAAVISLSETLRAELRPKNIGVTVIAPTFFKTNLMDSFQCTDERQRKMAQSFFAKSHATSEDVVRATVRAIRKNRLYVVPQAEGKVIWLTKRLFPETFYNTVGFFYKKGVADRFLDQ